MGNFVPNLDSVIRVLNSLPENADHLAWTTELGNLLRLLFDDIDDATVAFNSHFDCDNTPLAHSGIWLRQSDADGGKAEVFLNGPAEEHGLQEWIASSVADADQFHPPFMLQFTSNGQQLAWLIVWRRLDSSPLSESTRAALHLLTPFFTNALRDHMLRYRAANPAIGPFFDFLAQLGRDHHLTQQELRVLALRMYGQSYKEIASTLHLSTATVSQHLASVHRKAGVHSQTELFANFFAPFLSVRPE
jgi:DNA-binding CsgD family transcriptional regulator